MSLLTKLRDKQRVYKARWWLWKNSADSLKARVSVERYLFEASTGKKALPDAKKCSELAIKLGSYSSHGRK